MAEALGKVAEHKRALEEAEKIEKEFMTLMTGQRQNGMDSGSARKNSSSYEVSVCAWRGVLSNSSIYFLFSEQEVDSCTQECNGERNYYVHDIKLHG